MNTTTLPQWALDILSAVPEAGDGFHSWLFRAARALWKCDRSEIDIYAVLENAAATCGRYVSDREIRDAVEHSRVSAFQLAPPRYRAWPATDHELHERIIIGGSLASLWEMSPVRLDDNRRHTEELIDALFPGDPLLCVGRSNSCFDTRPRSEWHGHLRELALIVPNPMIARTGKTLDSKESAHALSNTGPRRFLVIEQDLGTIDEQAAVLVHLATKQAPMAVAVHSGNKSIHGWFYCAGQSEERLRKFMRYAVSLGADTSTWTRSQFVRLPDGMRENGKRQTVYLFNPLAIK